MVSPGPNVVVVSRGHTPGVTLVFADQRAATVPLAGVHTAVSVPGTEHAGEDWLGQGGVRCHVLFWTWGTCEEEEYSRAHSLLDTRGRGADRRQSPWILSYADTRHDS